MGDSEHGVSVDEMHPMERGHPAGKTNSTH